MAGSLHEVEIIMKRPEKLFAVVFVIVIFSMMSITITGWVIHHTTRIQKEAEAPQEWDGSIDYPLPNGETKNIQDEREELNSVFSSDFLKFRILDMIDIVKEKITNALTVEFRYRLPFVVMKYGVQKLLGFDMTTSLFIANADADESNSRDNVIPYNAEFDSLGTFMEDVDISEGIGKFIEFANFVKSNGMNFLFFECPRKNGSYGAFHDYSYEKEAQLLKALDEAEIDYLRVDDYMPRDKLEYAKMFYRTDHHWLPSSGIWANGLLCEYLNEHYGYSIDTSIYTDMSNYRVENNGDKFLGSYGKKVSTFYTYPDDFQIFYPTYNTQLTVFNSLLNKTTSGNIREILFDYDSLGPEIYEKNHYGFYGYGDLAYCHIHNDNVEDSRRILILKTSMADCMYAFLGPSFRDIDVLDLRGFKGSLKSFMERNKPDTVIIIYGISAFPNDTHDYNSALDFR